ncbi:lipid A biosynthesis protein [Bacteroidia bacterium]|nr:lipid A biosynthesis protein [Bacteroidia bacterium]
MMTYILYGFIWVLSFLPMRVLYVFSDFAYYLLYYIIGYRKKTVKQNLKNSFPEKGDDELLSIEKKFYRHLCDVFVEMYKTLHISEKELKKRFVFKNEGVLTRYFEQGKSVIGVLGHYGNWEWGASLKLWVKNDFDYLVVYKPLRNKYLDRMVYKMRSTFGALPVPKNDIFRKIVTERQEARLFLAGFIADQTPSPGNLNFWMDFLHQDTPILFGTEKIATKYGLPVVSVLAKKVKRGHYVVKFVDVCSDPAKLEHGELTRRHIHILEKQIQEAPEFWLWSHKRWKHKR